MKKVFYLFLLFTGLITSIYAQPLNYNQTPEFLNANAYWAYYKHIGLDWSNGGPVYDSNGLHSTWVTMETGATAVSDPHTGKLLFYTNGENTWNRDHELMSNGQGLGWPYGIVPTMVELRRSIDHGIQVVPFIGDTSKYYLFSLAQWRYHQDSSYQLYYSVLDMSLNNGKGNIVPSQKNIPFSFENSYWPGRRAMRNDSGRFVGYKYDYRNPEDRQKFLDYTLYHTMTTIPGNNCDVWLLTLVAKHNEKTLDTTSFDGGLVDNEFSKDLFYYAYRISEDGIDTVPVISPSSLPDDYLDHIFTVSPNREHLFLAYRSMMMKGFSDPDMFNGKVGYSELSRFDPNTGKVYEPMVFDFYEKQFNFNPNGLATDFFNVASAAFSPDSRKLYTVNSNFFSDAAYVTQYDIEQYDAAYIRQSRFIVDSFINVLPQSSCQGKYSMTLKSYRDSIFVIWGDQPKIGSINSPDKLGIACDFQLDYFSLPLNRPNGGNAINDIVYPIYTDNMMISDVNTCEEQVLQPRFEATQYKWSNGATSPTLTVNSEGDYWVSYSIFKNNCIHIYTDSFRITREGFEKPMIRISIDTLSTVLEYNQYQWLLDDQIIPNAIERYHVATQNGNYSVVTVNEEGCIDTSDVYPITNLDLSVNTSTAKQNINIYPNPAQDQVFIKSAQPVKYRLLDMTGREIIGLKQANIIDVSPLSTGVYQLIIYDIYDVQLGNWKISKQ